MCHRWVAGLALFFLGWGVVHAQTTRDTVGTITDTSGALLPGVTVQTTSPSLQGTRVGVSGRDGIYHVPGVPPGIYRINVSLPGFGPAENTATVSLDATATVNFQLQLAAREEVLVSGEIRLVDVTSTTGGTNYVNRVISRLPVTRNYADIVRSNPGVGTDQGETQGRSLALTIYGATSVENQWIVDGINTTNVIKGFQGKAINNEFIQEVEVKTGGYQAEYGRALGGIINVITKSGGNEFHGDGFLYYDSSSWKAAQKITEEDSIIGSMRIAGYKRTDFGADLGGYLLKDRLWFFAAYDRVRVPATVSRYFSSDLVPNTLEFPLDSTDSLYSGKLTWNLGAGTNVVATAFSDPTTNSGAGAADPRQGRFTTLVISNPDPGTWEASRYIGGTDYSLRANRVLGSSGLLGVQGSRHRDRYELKTTGSGSAVSLQDFTCSGGTPAEPCRAPFGPNFVTGGFGPVGGPRNRNTSTRDQYRGDLNLYIGSHEIKLGADSQDAKTNAVNSYSGGQLVTRLNEFGQVYYRHTFYAASATDLTPVDNPVNPRTKDLGAYVQDSWRVLPGLTVNAGLRWDQEDVRDYRNVSVIKTTAEWQPRLGIVWDPKKDGVTKVYAFAGRFYYALPTDLSVRSYGASTLVRTFNFDPVSVAQDPNVLNHEAPLIRGGSFSEPVDSGLKGIYQDEYTLGVERLLDPTFSVALKATYRRLGRAIEDRCDLGTEEGTYCGIMNPGSNGTIARGGLPGCNGLEDAALACTDTIPPTPEARRLYRGIEILARKSVSEKLWIQASYLYSSLRGNYDGEVSSIEAGQTDPGINADFDYAAYFPNSYGRLYQDRPHNVRLDGYYATPWKLWVGLQAYLQSGAPLSRIGYFSYGFSDVQLVQKGTDGRLPATWEANLTLGYPLALGPVTVTAQLYVFNLFNNQIRTSQNMVWSAFAPPDYPKSLFDPNQEQNNPEYRKITSRQEPRLIRGAIRISF
jgi:hypothetical protein